MERVERRNYFRAYFAVNLMIIVKLSENVRFVCVNCLGFFLLSINDFYHDFKRKGRLIYKNYILVVGIVAHKYGIFEIYVRMC